MTAVDPGSPERFIRPYQESDEAEVAAVWYRSGLAAYTYLPTWQALTPETAAYVFKTIIRPQASIWVCEHQRQVVGYLSMRGSYIDRLYIDPLEWHQGWGRRLVHMAKQLSPSGLELHTHQENWPARRLYESEGFQAFKFGVSPAPESAPDVEYHWRPEDQAVSSTAGQEE